MMIGSIVNKRKTGYNLKLKMGARIGNWSQLKGGVAGGEG